MTDTFTSEHRSWMMSRVRGRDTKPELIVRSLLHRCGYRFSTKRTVLPGKPDIIMPKHRAVVFVHGCFWHRHYGCRRATYPGTNRPFWKKKLDGNVRRDKENARVLRKRGWRVIFAWECQIMRDPEKALLRILHLLHVESCRMSCVKIPSRNDLIKAAEARLKHFLTDACDESHAQSGTGL